LSKSNSDASIRFAIDTGGTFTDIVVLNETTGEFYMDKAATTPDNTIHGVIAAIDKARVNLKEVGRFFVHGSTTALNALLERKGVRTAYVATKGFRDVPEIMRYNRPEMYNPKYHKPAQIVPRHLRFEVSERMNVDGSVFKALDESDAREVAAKIRHAEVGSVAVCLLHAYRNGSHEERLREILREELPGIAIAISSAVAPEHREFERSMTTILNAYLAPVVERWVVDLERELRSRGFAGEVVLTKSDGGGMTAEAAKRSPINMLLSGPAGGVIGGMYMAEAADEPNMITMDVGGTSFDVAMIKSAKAGTQQETSVNGYPILIPNLDIRTIGAGGGSLAWVDSANALHVGPQSAAAVPGPICYRRGGTQPTVTDAFVVNGYIDPKRFLGGQMTLDVEGAHEGIKARVADPLGISLMEGSSGILRIATANMAEAVKSICSELGDDPRDFSLLCFGGGGPLFGAFLIDELAMPRAVIPIVPAAFSAWGMLMVDLRHDVVKSVSVEAAHVAVDFMRMQFEELSARGTELLRQEGVAAERHQLSFCVDMRYVGQEHTVTVPVDFHTADEALRENLYRRFEGAYESVYGYRLGLPAELVNFRLTAVGKIPTPKVRAIERGTAGQRWVATGRRKAYDFLLGQWLDCAVFDRATLLAGVTIDGPALIEESTTTTIVRASQVCKVDSLGNLILTRR
jgi:N-methylhydantoinase A